MGRLNYQVGDRINPFYAVPVGTVLPFAGSSIPAGWLECAGQVLSRATYPDLFAAIGTTYGAATPETFNLPDLRGEFLRGWDNGKGVDPGRALGSAQGDENKAHRHDFTYKHTSGAASNAPATGDGALAAASSALGRNIITPADHAQLTNAVSATGGSETRPRNVAVRFCIRAFGSIENSGLIDVGALAVEVSDAVKIGDFIGANQSKASSGYQKLPGGLILQWGTLNRGSWTASQTPSNDAVTFPVAFPNGYLSGAANPASGATAFGITLEAATNTGFFIRYYNDNIAVASLSIRWIAIGY